MNARGHAIVLMTRLSAVELDEAVAIVVGSVETSLAAKALQVGMIGAYVAYSDTAAGVLVERHGTNDSVIALVDVAIEHTAADLGSSANDLKPGAQA